MLHYCLWQFGKQWWSAMFNLVNFSFGAVTVTYHVTELGPTRIRQNSVLIDQGSDDLRFYVYTVQRKPSCRYNACSYYLTSATTAFIDLLYFYP